MKHLLSIVAASFFFLHAAAQSSSAQKEKVHFSSNNNLGILVGGGGEGATVQTINGVRYKSWNFGIGTGIDWYGVRSIPLVADVRRSFTNKKFKPFVYGNGGINFPWATGDSYSIGFSSIETAYKNAFYGEFGLGYKVSLKNQTAITMSAGFSYKEIKVEQTNTNIGIPGFSKTYSSYEYYYRRIAIRMGFSF
ncbi:MAG: hypothetical protein V4722_09730 [Bacteroidota bacterium]